MKIYLLRIFISQVLHQQSELLNFPLEAGELNVIQRQLSSTTSGTATAPMNSNVSTATSSKKSDYYEDAEKHIRLSDIITLCRFIYLIYMPSI